MKKVLLLNPPGKDIYIRDYYCSKTTQADYVIPPVDLLMLSAVFSDAVPGYYEIKFIDAVVEKLSVGDCLAQCLEFAPDAVVSLVGAVSWEEDKNFLKNLRDIFVSNGKPAPEIIVSGDILMGEEDEAKKFFEELGVARAAIFDFTNRDAPRIAEGDFASVESAIYRRENGDIALVKRKPLPGGDYPIGVPLQEFFVTKNYRHPFSRRKRFATVLTEFGCPYDCSFCIIGTLPYKRRPVEEVLKEVRRVKSLGVSEIFFATQTFGVSKSYTLDLCRRLQDEKIGWFTFSRVDVADEELLVAMKRAGCHTIIFGVESGSDEILRRYRKGYDKKRIREVLLRCRRLGISTVGTFILGLPEDTRETLEETLAFIKELPLDYASFNVAVPRPGTDLRREAISGGLIDDKSASYSVMDQSRADISAGTRTLSGEEVLYFRRKMVSAFYLSPVYIVKRLLAIRSWQDLVSHIRHAFSLVKRTWG